LIFNHGLTRIDTDFVFASFGVFARIFVRYKHLQKLRPHPPGSVEAGPHLGSWRKRCFISKEKAQNAQKGQKNGHKVLFLVILFLLKSELYPV